MVDTTLVNRKNWERLLGLWLGMKQIKGQSLAVVLQFSPDLQLHYKVLQGMDMEPVYSGRFQMHLNARQCIFVDHYHKEQLYPAQIRFLNTDRIRVSGLAVLDAEYIRTGTADMAPGHR